MTTREDLTFVSGTDRCAAWWYPASGLTTPRPVIVMAHGLTGTRRDRLGAFAERFAAAGFAALVFDHRGFGDSTGEPDLFIPARQLEDWRAAIAYARTRPEVDADKVVTFGSSMGGGNALAAAAEDARIAAAISQVPFLDILSQAHRGSIRVLLRMLLTAARGGFLPAVGQPHEAAFINAPDSERGWRHVVAIGEDSQWRNRVSARWLLGRPFRPSRAARRLHCPWLVCVGEQDQVAAPGPAIRAARRAPHAILRTYPGVDHFDIYDGPEHEAIIADQIDFLHSHFGTRESVTASRNSHESPSA
ncbi:alpha/beta hydrolase [Nocardia sp. CA-129566]|uniref:alpha/beta hydrolase n=1 Tax=Nocardia sp. CA-129566 TaxID=3239976 RepID=UPI003D979878